MSSWNFVLNWVEHEKRFITWGPELLKLFCTDIQDGSNLEILTSPSRPYVGLSLNLVGVIGATWWLRIYRMVLFWYPRWIWSSWNSSNNISETLCWIELNLCGKHQSNMEIQIYVLLIIIPFKYSKTCVNGHHSNRQNKVLNDKCLTCSVPRATYDAKAGLFWSYLLFGTLLARLNVMLLKSKFPYVTLFYRK